MLRSPQLPMIAEESTGARRADTTFSIAAILLPTLVWLFLYARRSSDLGFYHDDWITAKTMDFGQFLELLTQFASRPILAVLQYLSAWLLGNDPVLWQSAMALLALLSSFAIGLLAKSIARVLLDDTRVAALSGGLSAALWLSFPWSLGYTAFPTTLNGMVSICILCALISNITLMWDGRERPWRIIVLFLVLVSIFEIFWFFPVLIAALVVFGRPASAGIRDLARSRILWALVLIQISYIIYNRALFYFGTGQNKPIGSSAFYVFSISLNNIKGAILENIYSPGIAVVASGAIFVVFIFSILLKRNKFPAICALSVIILGVSYSMFVYAAGGYTIQFSGLGSRTMFGVSFWLAFLPAVILPVGASIGRPIGHLCAILMLIVIGAFSASLLQNMKPWQRTWEFEQDLLSRFPIGEILPHLDRGSLILVDAERADGNVEGFEAFWDISGALHARFPALRAIHPYAVTSGPPLRVVAAMANFSKFRSAWDGQALSQSWCAQTNPLWTFAASTIVIWSYQTGKLEVRRAPFSLGCDAAG